MPEQPKTFQIGDTVTWTSHANGNVKTKTGKVVAIIPPDIVPVNHVYKIEGKWNWRRVGVTYRNHESYLIQVGKSKRLYWPLVKYLEKAEPEMDFEPTDTARAAWIAESDD